jgi:hypothetical protein
LESISDSIVMRSICAVRAGALARACPACKHTCYALWLHVTITHFGEYHWQSLAPGEEGRLAQFEKTDANAA